jgi:hypothetical protein
MNQASVKPKKGIDMHAKERPNAKAALDNLRKPLSSGKKISLVLRNFALRIVKLQNCCGHPGEPGC